MDFVRGRRTKVGTRKSVKIGEVFNRGKDEWYCFWYKCPVCNIGNIARGFSYCPDCGIKLKWED